MIREIALLFHYFNSLSPYEFCHPGRNAGSEKCDGEGHSAPFPTEFDFHGISGLVDFICFAGKFDVLTVQHINTIYKMVHSSIHMLSVLFQAIDITLHGFQSIINLRESIINPREVFIDTCEFLFGISDECEHL